jgi:hypothetical protein
VIGNFVVFVQKVSLSTPNLEEGIKKNRQNLRKFLNKLIKRW